MDERNLDDLVEHEIDIEGKGFDDEEVRLLWAKQMLIIDSMRQYWRHYLERGKTCFDFLRGVIFDDETREEYEEVYDKFCVEPRKMKPRINSLAGHLMKSRRSGQVTTEGGSLLNPSASAENVEVVNLVLKHMEQKWKERLLIRDVTFDALVSCYPCWLWFTKVPASESLDSGMVKPTFLPWDSTMVAPYHFRMVDGSDITSVVRTELVTTSDLIDTYPEREEIIRQHTKDTKGLWDKSMDLRDTIQNWDLPISSAEKDRALFHLMTGINSSSVPSGFHVLHERTFQIIKNEIVAINIFNPKQFEIKPGTWDDERWQQWLEAKNQEENTRYSEGERRVKILWTVAITDSGLVLTNGDHWFQENGRMPGCIMIPAMIDRLPSGPAEDMLNDLMAIAVTRTEFLDDVKKNTGKVIATRDGTISNPDDLAQEFSRPIGFMNIKQEAPPFEQCFKEIDRKPNTTYLEYAQMIEADLDENTLINKNIQGQHVPDQAGIAKQLEIGQGLLGQSIYVDNYNEFWTAYQNLKLDMIPYAYNQFDIIEVMDEEFNEQTKVAPINAPILDAEGKVVDVVNDITSAKYKWKMTPVDDSPTAKEEEQKKFVIFMNAVPGPVMQADPSGKLLARLMMSMSNRMIRDAGKALAEDAQMRQEEMGKAEKEKTMQEYQQARAKLKIEAEKAGKMGMNFSITGEQLAQFPSLAEMLIRLGYIKPQQTQQSQQAVA